MFTILGLGLLRAPPAFNQLNLIRRVQGNLTHQSIKDEIKRLRVGRLKLMVEETRLPLGEIALSFGSSSAGQFSRYFREATGMTPSAYRKRYGEAGEA